MDDDKQDKTGTPPGGDAAKRPPPTIELTASSVSDSTPASDAAESDAPESDVHKSEASASDHAESSPATEPSPAAKPSRTSSIFISALTGAVAAALVLGVAKSAGWLDAPVQRPPVDAVSRSDVDSLGARLAKIETDVAKPVPAPRPVTDPALVMRLDAVEKSLASLRGDVAAARGQSEGCGGAR